MKKHTTSQRLKEIITLRNLKQVDILKAAEPYCKKYGLQLTKSDLSQYVSGKVEPGQDKLTLIGLALNISEAWLMGYEVPMERDIKNKADTSNLNIEQLSNHEQKLILSYRSHPELQTAVDKILDIEESVHNIKIAARNGDNKETIITDSEIQKILDSEEPTDI